MKGAVEVRFLGGPPQSSDGSVASPKLTRRSGFRGSTLPQNHEVVGHLGYLALPRSDTDPEQVLLELAE